MSKTMRLFMLLSMLLPATACSLLFDTAAAPSTAPDASPDVGTLIDAGPGLVDASVDTPLRELARRASADSEQITSGQEVDFSDLALDLGEAGSGAEPEANSVAIQFDDIAIPPDAVVINATITFRSQEVQSQAIVLAISLDSNAEDTVALTPNKDDIRMRNAGEQFVSWPVDSWDVDATKRTPDLSPLVEQQIARPGWATGGSLVFLFVPVAGVGRRSAYSIEGSQASVSDDSLAPELKVEFTSPQ